MKEIIITLLIAFSINNSSYAQNYIYKGDTKCEATDSWYFVMNTDFWQVNPSLTVAKHSQGGYLMIAIGSPSSKVYISGIVYLFLGDGTIIKCLDRGIRDYVDEKTISLYNLTNEEIEKMKVSRIIKIRFSIMNLGTYTADNKKNVNINYSDPPNPSEKEYYETDVEISKLFKKE
jgi:hypothetical protein